MTNATRGQRPGTLPRRRRARLTAGANRSIYVSHAVWDAVEAMAQHNGWSASRVVDAMMAIFLEQNSHSTASRSAMLSAHEAKAAAGAGPA